MPEFVVTLNSHLSHLREVSPGADVPSIKQLAESIGVSTTALSRIANNHVTCINRQTIAAVIHDLRRRGFDTQVADVVRFVE